MAILPEFVQSPHKTISVDRQLSLELVLVNYVVDQYTVWGNISFLSVLNFLLFSFIWCNLLLLKRMEGVEKGRGSERERHCLFTMHNFIHFFACDLRSKCWQWQGSTNWLYGVLSVARVLAFVLEQLDESNYVRRSVAVSSRQDDSASKGRLKQPNDTWKHCLH